MKKSTRKQISNSQLIKLIDLFDSGIGLPELKSHYQWYLTMTGTRRRFLLWLKARNLFLKRNFTEQEAYETYQKWQWINHQVWHS